MISLQSLGARRFLSVYLMRSSGAEDADLLVQLLQGNIIPVVLGDAVLLRRNETNACIVIGTLEMLTVVLITCVGDYCPVHYKHTRINLQVLLPDSKNRLALIYFNPCALLPPSLQLQQI